MLEWLKLENVGPAPKFELDFAPRVNLITGDNGLGKSFLLDVAWWALTETWNPESNVVKPNRLVRGISRIEFKRFVVGYDHIDSKFDDDLTPKEEQRSFSYDHIFQAWSDHARHTTKALLHTRVNSLVVAMGIDGVAAIYDPSRPVVQFAAANIWDGLEQNKKIVCNGLIRDWATWQLENGEAFKQFKAALKVLSPDVQEILEPGKLTRVSLDDARDIPTLKMPYGQEVPVVYASAGIRRVVALAYLMVWAWQEHLRAAQLTRRKPTQEMVILIDELEEHLHPRWQRVILPALLEVAKTIMSSSDVRVQIIAATHSPMVMASLEPLFDPEQDAWFDLNLVNGEVTLEKMLWRKHSDANAWLESEAFDLPSTGSIPAGITKENAAKALQNPKLSKKKFLEHDSALRGVLSDTDEFWIRWRFVGEKKGWL